MLREYFTEAEIAVILDVDMVSAKEMLDGMLDLEVDELLELVEHAGVNVDELLKR